MWVDGLLAYAHFIAVFGVGAHLALDFAWLRGSLDSASVARLARADKSYLAALGAALVTGGLRLAFGIQGWGFYGANPIFYAKLVAFVVICLLSIQPALVFVRWARQAKRDPAFAPAPHAVARVRRWVLAELLLFSLIPLLAVLMARGIGSSGTSHAAAAVWGG
jgi:putative membrane protein